MFYLYILQSDFDKSLYIGFTDDLKKRFGEHNQGMSQYTKNKLPYRLIYYEAYYSKRDALIRENKLKKFKNSYKELVKRLDNSIKK